MPVREPVRALRDLQLERLATAPFLLLSVREADEGFWSDLVAQPREPELFAAHGIAADDLVTATLSFLWYLARRNPYAHDLRGGAGLVSSRQRSAAARSSAARVERDRRPRAQACRGCRVLAALAWTGREFAAGHQGRSTARLPAVGIDQRPGTRPRCVACSCLQEPGAGSPRHRAEEPALSSAAVYRTALGTVTMPAACSPCLSKT